MPPIEGLYLQDCDCESGLSVEIIPNRNVCDRDVDGVVISVRQANSNESLSPIDTKFFTFNDLITTTFEGLVRGEMYTVSSRMVIKRVESSPISGIRAIRKFKLLRFQDIYIRLCNVESEFVVSFSSLCHLGAITSIFRSRRFEIAGIRIILPVL